MRCHDARNLIDRLQAEGRRGDDDAQLAEHLESCHECRAYLKASEGLERLLEHGRVDDVAEVTPIELQRQQVQARAAAGKTSARERTVAWRWLPDLSARYRGAARLASGMAVLLITAISIIPFTFHRTVGYDLNLDGVDHSLVQDDERICELLFGLGLDEAGVDRCGCDTTACCLSILDLKSEQEAMMVAGAIGRLHDERLRTRITPIKAKASRSLLQRAGDIFRNDAS